MTKVEKAVTDFVLKYKNLIFLAVITILAMYVRLLNRDFESGDFRFFLGPWYDTMAERGGLKGLSEALGDYGMPYQFIIGLMTYIPITKLHLYKYISCSFDFFMAFFVGKTVCIKDEQKLINNNKFIIAYGITLFIPTVYMNSAMWAQCDSMYCFFIVHFLYCFLKEHYNRAFAVLGFAFALKLQAVFILPFIFYVYFSKKNFSIFKMFFSLLTFLVCNLPGYLFGRSFFEPLYIYMYQSREYKGMYLNYPSFWNLLLDDYEVFGRFAILLTMAILGIGLFIVISKNEVFSDIDNALLIAAWTVYTCVMFLPNMHERYGYLADILLLVIFLRKRNLSTLLIAILGEFCSMTAYKRFLLGIQVNFEALTLVNLFNWFLITVMVFKVLNVVSGLDLKFKNNE
ncbi:MAG: hypothetical protein HUJ98_01305 [Bacteroidaceae bacterium]|nr:hypothetical protein [Bacteroidaceae bacterium]